MVFYYSFVMFILLTSFSAIANNDVTGNVSEMDSYKKWSLYRVKHNNDFMCYIGSFPDRKEGNYTKRDEPYIVVINNEDGEDEVSISAGYPYLEKSNVMLSIDGTNNYTLFTRGGFAWAIDHESDSVIVSKMMNGIIMKVSATSQKGTKSVDTYSLLGFTKMYKKMKQVCAHES